MGTISKISRIKMPYGSSFWYCLARLYGSWESKTFDPSRGGMGKRLKMPRTRLMVTVKRRSAPNRVGKVWGRAFKKW